ncbi:MAG: DUF892 family protein [Parafilimonas sp.]
MPLNKYYNTEGEEHCKAMEGLIKEGNALLSEDMSNEVMNAAIIAAAQKIEHYEISSYGTARAYALQLQLNDVAKLLETTLNEEYDANDSLIVLALFDVNLTAEGTVQASETPRKKSNQKVTPKKAAPKKSDSKPKSSSVKNSKQKSARTNKARIATAISSWLLMHWVIKNYSSKL